MNRVQLLKYLLECRAELVEKSSLASKDCIAATGWSLDHAEKCVGWWVRFIRVISMVFGTIVAVCAGVPTASQEISQELKRWETTRRAQLSLPASSRSYYCLIK
jgi:hypothetical protein